MMACLIGPLSLLALAVLAVGAAGRAVDQSPLSFPLPQAGNNTITRELFFELKELACIVDISYCVGTAGLGIQEPFTCVSHCGDEDFKNFELVTTWNTGSLLSDSYGYIALSHPPSPPRILLAFRTTYSIANTIVDLSTFACAIIANNSWDGFLTETRTGAPIQVGLDGILRRKDYHFRVSQDADEKYAIVPSFVH